MKILDVGSGAGSMAEKVFDWLPDKQITRLDADAQVKPDILHDITQPLPEEFHGQFDIVYVSHVLEHVDRDKVIATLRYVISAVKDLGEVWVVVPSMEWAANEIINKRDGIHVQMNVFGGQSSPLDFHKTGFTLFSLRQLMEICGLIIRRAYQSPFAISHEGKQFGSLQNIVVGARYDALNDPADAIEAVNASA